MRNQRFVFSLLGGLSLLFLTLPGHAQDARSLAMGRCGAGLEWGPAALVWNPATLKFTAPEKGCAIALTGTTYDSTNTGGPVLDYSLEDAAASEADPIRKAQDYRGLVGIQFQSFAGGFLYDQTTSFRSSQSALDFLTTRAKGTLGAGSVHTLDTTACEERINTLAIGYSQDLPLGQMSGSIGGTLKLHQGSRLRQSQWSGTFTQGSTGGYDLQEWSAKSGSGFSWDTGFFFKPSSNIQAGYFIGNVNSSYKWKAQKSLITLDPTTGIPTSVSTTSETVQANRPRLSRLGVTLCNQDHSSLLTMDYIRQSGKKQWHFGFERILSAQHIIFRAGTFKDDTCDRRIWTAGLGYFGKTFEGDLAIATRKFPVLQDSAAFGLGLSFSKLF